MNSSYYHLVKGFNQFEKKELSLMISYNNTLLINSSYNGSVRECYRFRK